MSIILKYRLFISCHQIIKRCIGISLIALSALPIFCNDMRFDTDVFKFDNFDDIENSIFLDEFLDSIPPYQMPTRQIDVKSILGLLEDIGAFQLLDQDFYLRTNPFVQRSLLDLPLWEIHGCAEPTRWIVGGHLFWNHMDRSVFNCFSTNINSYLDLQLETLFTALDELRPEIQKLFPHPFLIEGVLNTTNVRQLLTLFENFTVQQRRVGIMLHAWRQWQAAEIRMLLPLYYLERNLFTRPAEQSAIDDAFGALDPDSTERFAKDHAISDKVGFGDFRIEFDYAGYLSDTFSVRGGVFLTLPTAFSLAKGIQGSDFSKCLEQPLFDLQALFDLIPANFDLDSITPEIRQQALNMVIGDVCRGKNGFFLGALDRLNALLLEVPMGNERNVGIGLLFRSRTRLDAMLEEYEWSKHISFNNRLSVEFLTPSTPTRFFIRRNNIADFDARNFNSDNPQEQEDNLRFVERELVDKFYPYAVKTEVRPGVILRWTSRWCFSGEVWDLSIGSDVWIQTAETFKSFKCVERDVLSRLDIAHGRNSLAYQFKSMASFGLKIERPTYSMLVAVNAEGTSWAKNIGKDITASINVEANF